MASKSVIDELKRSQILELLEQGKRVDGRALDEPREISIEINAIPKANGSARVFLGDTEVLCGVKIQPDKPFPDMGDKGIFMCTAELFALGIALISIDIFRGSSSARPSILFPCSKSSRICDFFNSSITDFDAISKNLLFQSICH